MRLAMRQQQPVTGCLVLLITTTTTTTMDGRTVDSECVRAANRYCMLFIPIHPNEDITARIIISMPQTLGQLRISGEPPKKL